MTDDFFSETLLPFLKRNPVLVAVCVFGVLFLGFGFFALRPHGVPDSSVIFEDSNTTGTAKTVDSGSGAGMTGKKNAVMVDVSGAVVKPGVYSLSSDARVEDALTKAGGLSEKADTQAIAKTVNLAARVTDGMKLYFPFTGETAVMGAATPLRQGSAGQAGGLISINSGSNQDLDSLPGVGAVTVGKIIAGRPYSSLEELKTKKIVSSSVYDKIKDMVSL